MKVEKVKKVEAEQMPLVPYVSIMTACGQDRERLMGHWANAARVDNGHVRDLDLMRYWAREIERLNDAQWWLASSPVTKETRIFAGDADDANDLAETVEIDEPAELAGIVEIAPGMEWNSIRPDWTRESE